MKPPGCFCFLDSFVCFSKLLALFFPWVLFFFPSFPSDWSGLWLYSMSGIWCPKKGEGTGSRMGIAWSGSERVWWEFDEKWRSLKIYEDSVGPFRDSCALCPVLCPSGSWHGEKEIQIRTNPSHLFILSLDHGFICIGHMHTWIDAHLQIKSWDAPALFLSKSRDALPCSFPNSSK